MNPKIQDGIATPQYAGIDVLVAGNQVSLIGKALEAHILGGEKLLEPDEILAAGELLKSVGTKLRAVSEVINVEAAEGG